MTLEKEQYTEVLYTDVENEIKLLKERIKSYELEILTLAKFIDYVHKQHCRLSKGFITLLICVCAGGIAALVSFLLQQFMLKGT